MGARATNERPSYKLYCHQSALYEFEAAPTDVERNIKRIAREACYLKQPTSHSDICPMRGANNIFRIRYKKHRALCDLRPPKLRILLVDHRESVYSKLEAAKGRQTDA